jgi:ElaA protein
MEWHLKLFNELTSFELYAILRLRNEVFVVEQNCVYQDCDDKDPSCYHLMAFDDNANLVAYTRIVPPGISYKEPSIGRVVTSPRVRRTGLGVELMVRSVNAVKQLFGEQPIRIGAQYYLLNFYQSLGFCEEGEIYDEDGIKHIEMVKS